MRNAVALMVGLIAAAGCKSKSNDTKPFKATSLDACSFLTDADASDAFGAPVKLQPRDPQICAIDVPGLGSGADKVTALVDAHAGTDLWEMVAAQKPGPVLVNGLGEKAGWSDSTHGGSSTLIKLYVVKNGKTLSVTVSGAGVDTDAIKQKTQALAARALPRM